MDGEQNGAAQEEQNAQQQEGGQQASQQPQPEGQGEQAGGGNNSAESGAVDAGAYEAQIAERDARIGELEAQIAEAAESAEAAVGLREEIAALRKQGEDERVEFGLLLAGCRNVKAAKAVLEDHGGDNDALKAAESWMFADAPARQSGKTGLPNTGAAADEGAQLKRWEKIAGLDEGTD